MQNPDSILDLKPDPRKSEEFLRWIQEARIEITKKLALPPEAVQELQPTTLATYLFSNKRRSAQVVVGYGVNGALASRVSEGTLTASRPCNEEHFFKSPFGTMMMDAQWFWRTSYE